MSYSSACQISKHTSLKNQKLNSINTVHFNLHLLDVQMKGMPFNFAYIVDDEATENFQTRQEEGDKQGVVTGCFQVCCETRTGVLVPGGVLGDRCDGGRCCAARQVC